MEPLQNLSVLANWATYVPSTEGFVPPPLSQLIETDVEGQLQSLLRLETEGVAASNFVSPDTPTPGIVIGNTLIRAPLGDEDISLLSKSSTRAETGEGAHFLPPEKVQFTNPVWQKSVTKYVQKALAPLKTSTKKIACLFTGSVVVSSGTHPFDLRPKSESHFATVLVILPSQRASAAIQVEHGPMKSSIDLNQNAPFSTHFVAMYTGIRHAVLTCPTHPVYFLTYQVFNKSQDGLLPTLKNILGANPGISRAFAGWAHTVASGSKRPAVPNNAIFYHLDGVYKEGMNATSIANRKDRVVISHLAPPAKHYGFEIAVAHATIYKSCEVRIERGYKEDDLDYDRWDYSMADYNPDFEFDWDINALCEDQNHPDSEALLEGLEELVKRGKGILNYHADMDDEEHASFDGYGQDSWSDTFHMSCTLEHSFLIITPSETAYPADTRIGGGVE